MICRSFKEYVLQTLYDEIDNYIEKHISDNFDKVAQDYGAQYFEIDNWKELKSKYG